MTKWATSLIISIIFFSKVAFGQGSYDSIKTDYVEKTLKYLAADNLKGRANYTKEQLEAADFIGREFTSFGLEPFPGFNNYFVPFQTFYASDRDEKLEWNGRKVEDTLFHYIPSHLIKRSASLEEFFILQAQFPLSDNLISNNWKSSLGNILIWISLPDSVSFSEATRNLVLPKGMPSSDILVVLASDEPKEMKLSIDQDRNHSLLYNVVGVLVGDSLPDEAIIFSAHYDHINVGTKAQTGQIFNGANDDASGTTAVLALAQYFSQRRSNRRTLVFCLFAGEELGLFGSSAFVKLVVPGNIKAVLNIEMIGHTNASGDNSALFTGADFSNLFQILNRNLRAETFRLRKLTPDAMMLFQRSDNYPFALEGIPAHTFFCSDDKDPCYHQPCDDADRIDFKNMTLVIRAIAKSARSLIDGTDTPTRIEK